MARISCWAAFALMALAAPVWTQSVMPSDEDIRKMLVDRVDAQHQSVGIVVGVIGPEGPRVIAYGHLEKGDTRPLNGDTIFEIGSMTKVFTSLLLADMVQRGEVRLDDPVVKYLPAGVKMPERDGRSITLVDLATHTSGLPRMPANFYPKDLNNPFADYSVDQLYQFLSSYQLTRDIGSQYEYSNLGGGLLGHVLARREGTDYETLVRSRICDPLAMKDTRITLTPEMKVRLAVGHNRALDPVANWDLPTLAGAGALRSTANDLLTFLAANLGYAKTPLAPAMAAMLQVRRPTGQPDLEIALGWHVYTMHGKEIIWHNGGTGGYRTFMGFDPNARVGVVALSNTSTATGVDDIGHHLLDASFPLTQPGKTHTEVAVDPKVFDGYVGRYQLTPNFMIAITRSGNHLFAQATAQPQFEIFAEGERDFFLKAVDAQLTFVTDGEGKATELILHQNGQDQHAKRVGDVPPSREHKEVAVDPKRFDGYTGQYELAPGLVMNITREGDHLMAQLTGQPKVELFAEGEHEYFVKVVDVQITFVTGIDGRATELVVHQGGLDEPAKRIGDALPPKEHKEIAVDSKVLEAYVGNYRLAPNFVIAVTRDGGHLFAQATGQSKFEIFAEGERDFFYKVVDAQITFVRDANGKTTELIVHQNGLDQHAGRLP
jgi:serine-type D-Ala-D-Ala carboxypeptidase/endopeptidase